MNQDRNTLKQRSRALMSQSQPPVWTVTLVFLLSTTWLSNLAELFNPVAQELTRLSDAFQTASMTMDESAMNNALYAIQQLAQKPAFFVTVLVSILLALFSLIVEFGYTSYCLQTIRQEESGIGELFSRFYMSGKIIAAELLMVLFIFLWSLLFVIPGLVASYRYRMIPYLLLDDPELSVWEAFRQSKAMMKGRKMELFLLELSFLLWFLSANLLVYLVSALAGSGIVGTLAALLASTAVNLYLLPYLQLTVAQWYEALRQPEPVRDPFAGGAL